MKRLCDIVTVTIIRASCANTLLEWHKRSGLATTNIAAFYDAADKTVIIRNDLMPEWEVKSELHELGHAFYHQETRSNPRNAQNEAFACACELSQMAMSVDDAADLIDLGIEKLDSIKQGYPYPIDMTTIDRDALIALMRKLLERLSE